MPRDDIRNDIEGADDTGLVAGEELITRAETLGPLLRPNLPRADLHAALPDEHDAHGTIDELHNEMGKETPHRPTIEKHVDTLRALPELEALIVNWWDDPRTQRFIAILGQV